MCKTFRRLSYKTIEPISMESFTRIHTFQNSYNVRFLKKCISIHIEEMCVVSYVCVFQKEMYVQVSKLLAQGTICFCETGNLLGGFTVMFWESPALSVHSLCLCLYLHHYLLFCLFPCIYLFISSPPSPSVSMSKSLCRLSPYPCSFLFVEWLPSLSYTHKLAQNLIPNIMTSCWDKYRHLLSLLSTQCEVSLFYIRG